ncbi:MAG: putative transporter [Luteolibacter sp.]
MKELFENITSISPHATPILVIALTTLLGLFIGSIRVMGLKLGVAGMLFSGLLLGHFGLTLEPHLLTFLKEAGLVLFVFTVGLQLGPGFFNSLKKDGLRLNVLAALVIVTGAAIIYGGGTWLGWKPAVMAGIFSGATTNTPSLGAAQQLLGNQATSASMAYALVYPFAVVGIILALVILRVIFRIRLEHETAEFEKERLGASSNLQRLTIEVTNPNLDGAPLASLPGVGDSGVIISRIRRKTTGEVEVGKSCSIVHTGDLLLAVGGLETLRRATLGIGREANEDLTVTPGPVVAKRLLVTNRNTIGKSLRELRMQDRFGVTISRLSRQDMILAAHSDVKLQFGDMVNVVGEESVMQAVEETLGNSIRQINETSFASIFLGITFGVLLGLYPWALPGMPVPLRLGLTGGPLLVAILMGRMGRIGPLVIHMPINANTAFRELGIILFLGCVGLAAGGKFVETAFSPEGVNWMMMGLAVTMIPLLIFGFVGRRFMKINYLTLSGLLAGSMTDPPALAFANKLSGSDAPSLAYANVYPLTMLLRILIAQIAMLVML